MAKQTSGYVREINPSSTDSHQTSPAYMLTFIRWDNRDTFNYTNRKDKKKNRIDVRKPLIVYNDAIAVSVSDRKESLTPSFSATLLGGDINYSTAIHPGDYVIVNMVNWENEVSEVDLSGAEIGANSLRKRAQNLEPLNNYNDGFKGLFKVQTITRELRTDPNTGTKIVAYNVKGFGFTEFNSMVYYDPQIYNSLQGNLRVFQSKFDSYWSSLIKSKTAFPIQTLLQTLISALLGQNLRKLNTKLPAPQITYFEAPPTLGNLLGLTDAKYMCDIYNYVMGIWPDSKGGDNSKYIDPKDGFNPNIKRAEKLPSGFYNCPTGLDGSKLIDAEYWNNVKIWSILQKYANLTINEMYTTNRVNVNGRVMPTLVIRQKPFTSLHYKNSSNVTRFMMLPRWKISPDLIYDYSLGKDETARVNYVQVYTRSVAANDERNRARQTGEGNFVIDIDDIRRNGLRTYLTTANFDYAFDGNKPTKAKQWTNLIADWVINGNLREGGTLSCVGIQEPIAVGDNLELDNSIYHIEGVTHTVEIDRGSGRKTFRTVLTLSFGTDMRSDADRPVYPQMEHTDAFTERLQSHAPEGDQMMPGFSDTQHIAGRVGGEEVKETQEISYTLNPKPRAKKPKATTIKDPNKDTNSSSLKKIDPKKK